MRRAILRQFGRLRPYARRIGRPSSAHGDELAAVGRQQLCCDLPIVEQDVRDGIGLDQLLVTASHIVVCLFGAVRPR